MDTKLRLAIIARFNQIYGTSPEAEKFISFPRDAMYVFSPQDLELMTKKNADETVRAYYTKSGLARLLNMPVRDIFYDNHGAEEALWEIYGEVLKTAEVAISRNNADEADFDKAEKALYTTDEEGLPVKSPQYKRYCELRDKRFKAEEEKRNLISEGSEDTEALARVNKTLEDIQRDMSAGNLERFITEMETIRDRVTRNSPSMVWKELRHKYNPDSELETDLQLIDFAPTYISPADVMHQDWDSITLSKQDIDTLAQTAPQAFRDAFPPAGGDEGVTFEYRSVKIERPWFESEVFKSRYWRFTPNSGQGALAYEGHNGSAGRFPSYITALILLRNLKSASGARLMDDGRVMIMAYICKWLPACPDPDPTAEWGSGNQTAMFTLDNSIGGSVTARIGSTIIGPGPCDIGQKITLTATPDSTHILSSWQVNGKNIDAGNGQLVLTMTQAGLNVVPVWAVAMKDANMDIKVDGTTLVSISGGPNDLDMNAYKETCNIETIADNAFAHYPNLQRITIGASVGSIGRDAFRECKKLKHISIPASTRSIADSAFRRDPNCDDAIFEVDSNNIVYTAIDGMLTEKRHTALLHTIRCGCGASWFCKGNHPDICPKCGATFDSKKATDTIIIKPDEVVPFKLTSAEAAQSVNAFLKKKWFADPAFRSAVADNGLTFHKVNIPYWEWDIQGSGTFDIEIKTETKSKDATGKETTTTKTEMVKEEASLPDEHILIPASNLVKGKAFETGNRNKKDFDPEPGELFETCSRSRKQSLADARSEVDQKLADKAKSKIPTQGIAVKTVKHSEIEYISEKSILTTLPYWIGAIKYLNKRYSFLVDGYSGKVKDLNSYPKNKKKIWRTVGISAAAVAIIILLIILLT